MNRNELDLLEIKRARVCHEKARYKRLWKTDEYKSDKRKHSHRCRFCRKIIQQGENVYFLRVGSKKTWAFHADHAELPSMTVPGATYLDVAFVWAYQSAIQRGAT